MKNEKKCAECGGKVFLNVIKSTIEHPARDKRGRPIFERVLNKVSKRIEEREVMVTHHIRGLGTWHCANGCKDRHIKVKRFVGSGKENERGDSFIRETPVTRHILVRSA